MAEHADSMARKAGKMVDIDSEPTVDMEFDVDTSSSQESTLPDEINEDDERRYQGEEERDEERAERGDLFPLIPYRTQVSWGALKALM